MFLHEKKVTHRSRLLQRAQHLCPVINEVFATGSQSFDGRDLRDATPCNGDGEITGDGRCGNGRRTQCWRLPLHELDNGGGARGEHEGEVGDDARLCRRGEVLREVRRRENEVGAGDGIVCSLLQGSTAGVPDGPECIAIEDKWEGLARDWCSDLVEDIGGRRLACRGSVCGAVGQAVFGGGLCFGDDLEGGRVTPVTGCPVKVVEAVVPENSSKVVLGSSVS